MYLILLCLLSFLVTLLDQLLKYAMSGVLTYGEPISVIEGFFSLTLVFNTGAAFGILQDSQFVLVLPVLAVIIILVLFAKSIEKKVLVLPLSLLLGGTVGNFIDRVSHGYVIDFLDFYWRQWHWPAFNLADAGICIGITLLLWRTVKKDASNHN